MTNAQERVFAEVKASNQYRDDHLFRQEIDWLEARVEAAPDLWSDTAIMDAALNAAVGRTVAGTIQ